MLKAEFSRSLKRACEPKKNRVIAPIRFVSLDIDDNSCDLVVATSLFIHLTHDAVRSYMREIRRIMKKGARAYLTFFIYDEESVRAITYKDLKADNYGFYYVDGNFLGKRQCWIL